MEGGVAEILAIEQNKNFVQSRGGKLALLG
jgi:hypothetical protein